MSNKIFGINSQSKHEEDFGLGISHQAIEGSYVVATKQYHAIIPIH
jgi:hypothetical protein